ncbi:MAG TPA: adenylate/guanylate cyclase domain-containing protein [Solirubrobacteraceae bacterium]|nr:adenylate/guanylate cyclase domain-containing protein [Solirubrobacteraceae bacterium]
MARQIGVSPGTLRRWVRDGVVPLRNGELTPSAVAHARMVSRLRERGYPLSVIKEASQTGRLAFGYVEDMFPSADAAYTLDEVAGETRLEPALIERIWSAIGLPSRTLEALSEDDLQLLRYVASVLAAGLPLVAFLQAVRVYGQAIAQIADAEVRLFHLYVHEPLIRDGVPGLEIAEEMEGLARDLLPLASPIMDHLHQRFLQHFVEQDVVGHLEDEGEEELDLGRLRVAIAFADLAGYTRLTEEAGEEQALDLVERFVESVETTLPDEARVVKTIGDAVMIVSSDAAHLTEWAVGFQELQTERPFPRIGIHCGAALYRDGDYFGRAVNIASRVGARAAGREVLVTRDVVDAGPAHLRFQRIGEVRLKGFKGATELYLAQKREA